MQTVKACPLFGICGGCDWWNLSYDEQIARKTHILRGCLSETLSGVELPPITVVPSQPFEYRSRIELHRIDETPPPRREKKLRPGLERAGPAGFMGKKSRVVIPVNDCPVAVPEIRKALRDGILVPPPEKDRWTVFAATSGLLCEGGGAVKVCGESRGESRGKSRGKTRLLGRELLVDAGVFFQSNIALLEQMITGIRARAEQAPPGAAWDLYCGVGTFAVFLKDYFPRLVLMEAGKTALALARENLSGGPQSAGNTEFYALNDDHWVKEMRKRKNREKPAFVSVDPARRGLSAALIEFLNESAPLVLVYISCNPRALAHDAKMLAAGGFSLDQLTFYDFYPQTRHIETVAVFTGKM